MSHTVPNARRRRDEATSQPRVGDVLREIAYRLHATKKVRPEDVWPVLARGEGGGRPAVPARRR